jgi:hypothetical protein
MVELLQHIKTRQQYETQTQYRQYFDRQQSLIEEAIAAASAGFGFFLIALTILLVCQRAWRKFSRFTAHWLI